MKKLALFALLALIALATPGFNAKADDLSAPTIGVPGFPDISDNMYVAMVYHRLIGKYPNFESWARLTPEYQKMSDFDKAGYLQTKPGELRQQYSLMTSTQPIVLQFTASISKYSDDSEGYLVRNFSEETFFPYKYAGADYAVIPAGLMDFQFLPVVGDAQARVEKVLRNSRRQMRMVIYIAPGYASADPKDRMDLTGPDGKTRNYALISGKVTNVELYDCTSRACTALWSHGTKEYRYSERNELLNLKQ